MGGIRGMTNLVDDQQAVPCGSTVTQKLGPLKGLSPSYQISRVMERFHVLLSLATVHCRAVLLDDPQ